MRYTPVAGASRRASGCGGKLMIKNTCAVLAIVFSVIGLSACGSDDDSKSSSLPAWEQTCHDYCAAHDKCDADSSVADCYTYECTFAGTSDAKLSACQTASEAVWKCKMKQSDICADAAIETACATELTALGTACN
jgi:hypothetical protein